MLEIFNQMANFIIPEPYGTIIKTVCLLIIAIVLVLEVRRAYKQGYEDPISWIKASKDHKEKAFMWFGLLMLLFTLLYVSTPQVVFDTNNSIPIKTYDGQVFDNSTLLLFKDSFSNNTVENLSIA